MIVIINAGLGNTGSLLNILSKIGVKGILGNSYRDIDKATKLILPGVGAFDHGIQTLHQHDLISPLEHAVLEKKIPILGICLGMQLMCTSSEEGKLPGLNWIDAEIKRFTQSTDSKLKIPHMGWNKIQIVKDNPLIKQIEQRFYFIHSYYAICHSPGDILATTNYGTDFTAAFNRRNIFGVQFHPEKSHRFGMQLIKNFAELTC